MAITNRSAIYMASPEYPIDNIIGIHTGSFSVSAPSSTNSPTTATSTFTTGFGDTCLFQGIFSTNGTDWNDFGAMQPNLSTAGQPVLQTVTCYGWVDSSGVFTATGVNYYDSVHNTGTAYTIQYKVAFLAKDSQGTVTPIQTNEILAYDSANNYQKIFSSGSFSNGSGTTTIAHNLTYVPKVRAWFDLSTSTTAGYGYVTVPSNSISTLDLWPQTYPQVEVNSTDALFASILDGNGAVASGTVYYRIYLDS